MIDSPLMRWLLDIDVIPRGAQGVRLAWEHSWPGWLWALLLVVSIAYAIWSYSRLIGNRSARGILAMARSLVLVLLLLVIAGPMLELPRESIEQDWVLILADRSESMTIADASSSAQPTQRISREVQLQQILREHDEVWQELADSRHMVWLGFNEGAFALPSLETNESDIAIMPVNLGAADGSRTHLNTALEQALQRAAARPLSGVVVFSDGRTSDPPTRAVLRRLQADAVPVFTIALGSPDPLGDLAVRRVDVPLRAYIRDKVPVLVELDRLGSAVKKMGATIRLVDDTTGEEFDSVQLVAGDERDTVTLIAQPKLAGQATWRVMIETPQPDLIPDNNIKQFSIDLIDRPLRVLYVDGYPRWEYRYVKNILIREKSIESSIMLLSADRDFAQEGNQPITRLPRSPEEFAQFDVIIIGDVPGSFFTPEQLEMIRDQVANRGAGLLWIGGAQSTPSSYAGLVLADLLPMRSPLALPIIGRAVNIVPTTIADRLGVLRLSIDSETGWPSALSDSAYRWSQLHWVQRIEPGRLKPTAEVLAETIDEFTGAHLPVVIHMRFGAGRAVYVATDEIWRWRFGMGESLPEQFWVQMIRMLGRSSLIDAADQASLEVNPRRLPVGQPMNISLRLHDARLVDQQRYSVAVVLENALGHTVVELDLKRLLTGDERFAATFLPEITGTLTIRLDDPSLKGLDLSTTVDVFTPDDELRRPETDHGLLAALASETGGRSLAADEIDQLPELLPNRSITTINPLTERIWDTPLAFGLLLLAVTCEWIGRKMLRLA